MIDALSNMANGESAFVNVIAFSDTAKAALLALTEGDAVAIAGELRVSTYTDNDGSARPSLDLTAFAVMTEYHVTRKRKAINAAPSAPAGDLPDDERWLDKAEDGS